MNDRAWRFGVNLIGVHDRTQWLAKCRLAEELGYDVVLVPDHFGMPAPFPYLMAAAEATERVRLGTFVLNAAFYHPAVLARDVLGTATLTGGRLELGLGTGYVRAEFDAAGIDYGTPGSRVDHLVRTVTTVQDTLAEQHVSVPLLLGGNGKRMLRLAAEHADIIGFTGATADRDGNLSLGGADALAERVAYARELAGPRDVELNILVQTVQPAAQQEQVRTEHFADFTAEEFAALPTVLFGSPAEIADKLRAHRETFGFTYITVIEQSMETFAEAIPYLRAPAAR